MRIFLSVLIFSLGLPALFGVSFVTSAARAAAPEAEVKVLRGEKVITLQISPPPNTHLNYDGPWKLQINGAIPLSNHSGVFGLDAFDKTKQAFQLPLARGLQASESGDYVLTYFFCATDNSWCRRAQAKGNL